MKSVTWTAPVSGLRLVLRLQHERVRAVATPRPEAPGRRQEPPPARLVTEEGREARSGVEPRETEPIDRSVATHQRRGVRVADHRVVLERKRHGCNATC